MSVLDKLLWVESYRPTKISDIILPSNLKKRAESMVAKGNLVNLILSGTYGTGKTTLAKAMCAELGADLVIYNGSDGSLNLEELRENISNFAHTTSINNNGVHKVILIDEADGLSGTVQKALNNAIEKYAKNCRFILTCNYPEKIIGSLHSRCALIDFKFTKADRDELASQFGNRIIHILNTENVKYDVNTIRQVIIKYYPDNRKILNELQEYSNYNGCIDDGLMVQLKVEIEELFVALNAKNFSGVKQWLTDYCSPTIFNMLFKECEKYIPNTLIPLFIVKIGEAQKYHGMVPNPELNALACLTEYIAES
jgi:DNA polymerase III delta prime subunit